MFFMSTFVSAINTTNSFNEGNLKSWKEINGNWKATKGELQIDTIDEPAIILLKKSLKKNCIIEVDATFDEILKKNCWISVAFRAKRDGSLISQCYVKPQASTKKHCGFWVSKKGKRSVRKTASSHRNFQNGVFRHIKIVVQGEKVTAYLDSDKLFESSYCVDISEGFVGLVAQDCKARFKNFIVTDLPDTEPLQPLENSDYLIVAHRGYSEKYPENTIAAIEGGIDAGSNGIEFDVYRCASGEIVLLHDSTLDRTTDGTGKVSETTLADLRKLDAGSWKGKQFKGERIPTLDEALNVFKNTDATAVVEIKTLEVGTQQLADCIASHKIKACVISFNSEALRRVKEANSATRCAFLVSRIPKGNDPATWLIAQTQKLKCEIIDVNYKMLSPELIKTLQSNGIEVWAWTVNDIVVMQALVDWGIDGITTDRPEARDLIK